MASQLGTRKKTRQRLLEAACNLFALKGYEGATLRDICDEAGANIASVNYHFGDKHHLYLEAINHAHQQKMAVAPTGPEETGTPPEAQLRRFIGRLLARMLDEESIPQHRQLMMREMAHPTEATENLVRSYIAPEFERLLGILDRLLPAGVDAERRHLLAFSVVGQCLHYKVAAPVVRLLVDADEHARYTPDRLARHVSDVILAAIDREGTR